MRFSTHFGRLKSCLKELGAAATKPIDGAAGSAGLDTMAEDLDQLKYDVGELKDLLGNNKGSLASKYIIYDMI